MQSNQDIFLNDIKLNPQNNIEIEKYIWNKFVLKIIILLPSFCNLCNNKSINIYDNNSIYNPYIGKCTNAKCRKMFYLRQGTILGLYPKTPVSTILYIIKMFILEKKNTNEIYMKIKGAHPNMNISKEKIREILKSIRLFIAHYIKDSYIIEDISQKNAFQHFAIDESDFVKIKGNILWVIGIINTHNKLIRLELSYDRTTEVMKKIVKTHIKTGNIVVTDGWSSYLWISEPYSGYVHSMHNHGAGNFGYGLDSTSHIEALWSNLKQIIKNIYYIIPSEDFVLYLGEAEFRRNINKFNDLTKWNEIIAVINYIRNIGIDNLYSVEYLEKITEK